ncbi:MAG: aldehyde dehydrogenase family protein, partial [Candidatus Neomarinimicrobiota bacterium]
MTHPQNQKSQADGIRQAFDFQAANYRQVGKSTALERLEKLKRLGDWIMDHRGEMQKAAYLDFQKPAAEVDLHEIWMLMTEIRHVRRNLKKWMRPRKVKTTLAVLPAESWIQNEPKGLCLIIAPWNFPFSLTIYPLISAIAAGNCAILKPSEMTPHCSALIEKMVKELYEENEVLVFQGDKLVAQALLELPFHHIFFTGSPQVGKKVMAAAALHLASVTLELGGKSPTIIDESADLKDTAEKVAWGKYINNGQICLAPDYILIQESIADKFMPVLKTSIKNIFGGNQ